MKKALWLILLCSSSALAGVKLVQQLAGASTVSVRNTTYTLGSTPAIGDVQFLNSGNGFPSTLNISSITQQGATWSQVVISSVSSVAELWFSTVTSASNTSLTITTLGTQASVARINYSEWSGWPVGYNVTWDTAAYQNVTASTASLPTITSRGGSATSALFIGQIRGGGNSVGSGPYNGWTALTTGSTGDEYIYQIVPVATVNTSSWPWSSSLATADIIADIVLPTPQPRGMVNTGSKVKISGAEVSIQ